MKDLEEIRGRCRIEDGHWLWAGALHSQQGYPVIHAPDFSRGGQLRVMSGMRAAWNCATEKPIPAGWRVYRTCDELLCVCPGHLRCMPTAEFGKRLIATGAWRGNPKRIIASHRQGRATSVITSEILVEILASDEKGVEIAKRLGLSEENVSKARRGKYRVFSAAGMFAGLMAPTRTAGARA